MTGAPDFVLSTFIRCSRAALWEALTDPGQMQAYHFIADRVERSGETYRYAFPDGTPCMTTRTLASEPGHRLEATFELPGTEAPPPSRTVFLIEEEGDHCRLTVEHYALTYPVVPGQGVHDGWSRWAAGLKTWLETGAAHKFRERQEAVAH